LIVFVRISCLIADANRPFPSFYQPWKGNHRCWSYDWQNLLLVRYYFDRSLSPTVAELFLVVQRKITSESCSRCFRLTFWAVWLALCFSERFSPLYRNRYALSSMHGIIDRVSKTWGFYRLCRHCIVPRKTSPLFSSRKQWPISFMRLWFWSCRIY
jgi:hypothetical protein